mgnify:FL=1
MKPALKGMAKAIFVTVQARGVRDGALVLVVPNEGHAKRAAEYVKQIEQALSDATGSAARVVIESESGMSTQTGRALPPEPPEVPSA